MICPCLAWFLIVFLFFNMTLSFIFNMTLTFMLYDCLTLAIFNNMNVIFIFVYILYIHRNFIVDYIIIIDYVIIIDDLTLL